MTSWIYFTVKIRQLWGGKDRQLGGGKEPGLTELVSANRRRQSYRTEHYEEPDQVPYPEIRARDATNRCLLACFLSSDKTIELRTSQIIDLCIMSQILDSHTRKMIDTGMSGVRT